MSDWPGGLKVSAGMAPRNGLSTAGKESHLHGHMVTCANHQGGVATWPSANLAIYVPVMVVEPVTVVQLACVVGTTAAGNIDLGIYDDAGNRLVSSGSTAIGGTGTIQNVDVTDTPLLPGVHYFAMNCSTTTTATFNRTNMSAVDLRACGVRQQAVGAVALPNPATFAVHAQAYAPFVIAMTRTVI
jgi:predicted phage gp36 major capsid-like protein